MSSKRVVGSSENRADVGAVSSFGLRKCRWGALRTPQSGLEPLIPRPWPEASERAAPTAADPKETLSSKRVVGSSENHAEVGAVTSFGLRKCRWAALGVPQSDPGSPVLRPWPETSATSRIPCISAVQGHGPQPPCNPRPQPPLYCFLSFLPPCFDQLPARRTWGSADSRGLRPLPPTPETPL